METVENPPVDTANRNGYQRIDAVHFVHNLPNQSHLRYALYTLFAVHLWYTLDTLSILVPVLCVHVLSPWSSPHRISGAELFGRHFDSVYGLCHRIVFLGIFHCGHIPMDSGGSQYDVENQGIYDQLQSLSQTMCTQTMR